MSTLDPCDLATWDDPRWCDDYLRLFPPRDYRPVDAPDSWHVRCDSCGYAETGLGMIEAHAIEGMRDRLTPCCVRPDLRAYPSMFEPIPPARCERCGLTQEHVHTCVWKPTRS